MPRMIDLIRASAVPSNIVQSAAKGSLSMPAAEMVEILVYLANHSKVFGEQARLTMAGWDEKSSRAIAADPKAPQEVLDYLASPQNLRPALLPALLANPAVSETALAESAASASREAVEMILDSARAGHSSVILEALNSNPYMSGIQAEHIRSRLSPPPASEPNPRIEPPPPAQPSPTDDPPETLAETLGNEPPASPAESNGDDVLSEEVTAYLTEHAAEIAKEEKSFQPIGGIHESVLESEEPAEAKAAVAAAPGGNTDGKQSLAAKKTYLSAEEQRGSALQKISKLDVKGRIQLAMKGNKEERSILVRDGTKVVALAVLESPKITDGEVEMPSPARRMCWRPCCVASR